MYYATSHLNLTIEKLCSESISKFRHIYLNCDHDKMYGATFHEKIRTEQNRKWCSWKHHISTKTQITQVNVNVKLFDGYSEIRCVTNICGISNQLLSTLNKIIWVNYRDLIGSIFLAGKLIQYTPVKTKVIIRHFATCTYLPFLNASVGIKFFK